MRRGRSPGIKPGRGRCRWQRGVVYVHKDSACARWSCWRCSRLGPRRRRRTTRSRGRCRASTPTTSTLDTSVTKWRVDTGGRTLNVLPTTLPALTPERAEVKVDDQQEGPGVVGPVTASLPQAVPAPGGRKTAVIAFNFATAPTSQPWTVGEIRQRVFIGGSSTSSFFREESYDQLWLTGRTGNFDGDVYGWYTLATAPTSCDYTTWATLAKTRRPGERVRRRGLPAHHVRVPGPVRVRVGGARLHARQGVVDQRRPDRARDRRTSWATTWACTMPAAGTARTRRTRPCRSRAPASSTSTTTRGTSWALSATATATAGTSSGSASWRRPTSRRSRRPAPIRCARPSRRPPRRRRCASRAPTPPAGPSRTGTTSRSARPAGRTSTTSR